MLLAKFCRPFIRNSTGHFRLLCTSSGDNDNLSKGNDNSSKDNIKKKKIKKKKKKETDKLVDQHLGAAVHRVAKHLGGDNKDAVVEMRSTLLDTLKKQSQLTDDQKNGRQRFNNIQVAEMSNIKESLEKQEQPVVAEAIKEESIDKVEHPVITEERIGKPSPIKEEDTEAPSGKTITSKIGVHLGDELQKQKLRAMANKQNFRRRKESTTTWDIDTIDPEESVLKTVRRLGIFGKTSSVEAAKQSEDEQYDNSVFDHMEDREFRQLMLQSPTNQFEEWIQWTKDGKMWLYPIDNEQGLEEEKSVGFHEHIFLDRYLEGFPKKGPVAHFMELVCIGLSKNPYLTVQQKKEHIDWFREYFKDKLDLIEESVQEAQRQKAREDAARASAT